MEGETYVTLALFNSSIDTVYTAMPLGKVPELTLARYSADGMTAMLDAIGITVTKNQKAEGKIVLVILTDGAENSSKEYRHQDIQNLLKEVQEENNWEVLFLGANIDAAKVAASINIAASKSVKFEASAEGLTRSILASSMATMSSRKMAHGMELTADEQAYVGGTTTLSNIYENT